jgi:hypothetical protein
MKITLNQIVSVSVIITFTIIFVISFIIYPDIGAKILYGKHPPENEYKHLEYSQIITSGNYKCMESASNNAQGNLKKFIDEFNKCNN